MAEQDLLQLKGFVAEIKIVLEAEWQGVASEVLQRLGKVLECAKMSTTRVEKQITDADEINADQPLTGAALFAKGSPSLV